MIKKRNKRDKLKTILRNSRHNESLLYEEMDRFIKTCNLPRPNEEEIGSLDMPFTSRRIETVIKILLHGGKGLE